MLKQGRASGASFGMNARPQRLNPQAAPNPVAVVAWHVTPTRNVARIRKKGLLVKVPLDMPEETPGVYLFPTMDAVKDAFGSWLDDRFDDDVPLTILEVDITGLSTTDGAPYEIVVTENISPVRVIGASAA
jgi:hypothetical protein